MGYRDRLQSVIFLDTPEKTPSIPSKLGFDGFESSFPDESKIIHSDIQPTAPRWLLHFSDRESLAALFVPAVDHAAALACYPDAVAAEPFTPTIRQPSAPLTAEEEKAIRAWLALIEETDPATIAEVIERCQRDADAHRTGGGGTAEA